MSLLKDSKQAWSDLSPWPVNYFEGNADPAGSRDTFKSPLKI